MKADYSFPEDYWNEVSNDAKDFIRKLLVVDPKKRMTGKEALKHTWLAGHAPNTVLQKLHDKLKNYSLVRKENSVVLGGEINFGK